MAIFITIGVHTPTLILTRVSEVQEERRAIPAAILGERPLTIGALRAIGTATHGRFQATRFQVIRFRPMAA